MKNEERRYYSDITEVVEVTDADNATVLLRSGWELLAIKEKIAKSPSSEMKVVVYVMGKKGTPTPAPVKVQVPSPSPSPSPAPTPSPSPPPSPAKVETKAKEAQAQAQAQPAKFFSCRYCGRLIRWNRDAEGKWLPTNPDGSVHVCKREGKKEI
jgi:hypothetical protein